MSQPWNGEVGMMCPCDSGRAAEGCCGDQARGIWMKQAARITEPQATGTVDGCYARSLGTCVPPISSEHYASRAVLEELDDIVAVTGTPWLQPGQVQTLRPKSLGSNVLCRGHNSALSPLDLEALRLVRTIKRFQALGRDATDTTNAFALFAGEDIERYLLKLMLGFMVSGVAPGHGEPVRLHLENPGHKRLVEALFGRSTIPHGGLHVVLPNGRVPAARYLEPSPIFYGPGSKGIVGVVVTMLGVPLAFVNGRLDALNGSMELVYRPAFIQIEEQNSAVRRLGFTWRNGPANGGLTMGRPSFGPSHLPETTAVRFAARNIVKRN